MLPNRMCWSQSWTMPAGMILGTLLAQIPHPLNLPRKAETDWGLTFDLKYCRATEQRIA